MKQKNDIIKSENIGNNIEKVLNQPSTRREFIRKTGLATIALPMLGLLGLVSKTTKAVGPNDPGCNVCDFACQAQCRDDCDTTCQNECGSQCSVACTGYCDGVCTGCGGCDTSCGGCGGSCGHCLGGGGGGQGGDGCQECDGSCSRNCASSASSHPSDSGGCDATAVDVSAYAKYPIGGYKGYAERCTPNKLFGFYTGQEFINELKNITQEHGEIGNLYIFSEGWDYKTASEEFYDGGFWANSVSGSGFYGKTCQSTVVGYKTLLNLQQELNNNTIKFASGKRIFLEGCHCGEIGNFVKDLASMTGSKVEAACGASTEMPLGGPPEYFRSAPRWQTEKEDSDYDGWIRVDENGNIDKLGMYIYLW